MKNFIAQKWKRLNRHLKIIATPFLLVGLAAVASLVFAYGTNDNKNGLVLDIDFSQDNYDARDRNFIDKSGNGNNAVSTNQAVFTVDKDGRNDKAMSFTSTNDEVVIPHNSNYKSASITVSFWYKPQNINKRHVIFTTWTGFTTEINSDRTFKWGLNGLSGQYFGTKKVNWDEWIYLTGTFDNSSKQQCIYFNGIKQECQTVTGSISYNTSALYLSGSWDWISGDFANAKIYNRALSENEIKDLYNSSKSKIKVSSLQKGLIAYFPMDGENYNANNNKLTDKSAYGNHAVNAGGILTSDRFGKSNGALNFGNSAAQEYTSSYIPRTSYNLTMSAWIKPSAYPSERGTIILGSGAYYLSLYNDGSIHTYWYGRTPSGYHSSLTGKAPIGEWTQVAAVWRNDSVDLYVNGVLKNTVAINNAPGNNSNLLILGAEFVGRQFKGAMSDVRIYNRALSDQEIEQLYTYYKPKTSASFLNKGLVLDMPLTSKYTKSEVSGSEILSDLTPYSNNGQNHGATINKDYSQFDGVSNYIESEKNIASIGASARTVSVWFMPEQLRTQNLLGYGEQSTGKLFDIYLSVNGQIGGHFYNSGYDTLGTDSPIYNLNQWQNFAITYDGNKAYVYFNGEYYKEKIISLNTGNSKLVIGKGIWTSPANFKGKISNVKIYNRNLSASEIKSMYDQGRGKNGAILNGLQ